MKYRADIDGIRAIAVLLVVLFHFGLVAFGQAGFIGVDVFFVISGYLISGIIWRDLERGQFSLVRFYTRRIRRLAPALMIVQLLMLVAGAILLLPNELAAMAKESIAAQVYLSNFYYWKSLDYFGLHADHAFLLHTWSLAVEEQFYLFYPLFLMAVHRWARRWFWPILGITTIVSFGLNLALVGPKPASAFYLLPMRAWELGVGALLPMVQPWFERTRAARGAATPLGLALIVLALAVHGPDTPFPGWFALLPVAAGACLLLGGAGEGNAVSRWLSYPAITFFGRISYPLYLIHWPLHVFATLVLPEYGLGWRWGMFAASIVIAWAITGWGEAPFRERKWLKRERTLVLVYLGAVAGVIALAGATLATHGLRGRFSPQVQQIVAVAGNVDPIGQASAVTRDDAIAPRARRLGAENAPVTWLIYGDSHARALSESISQWLTARGEAGEVVFQSSCMPVLDTGNRECRAFNRRAVAYAAGRPVLLVSVWREPIDVLYRGRAGSVLTGADAVADAQAAIGHTVAELRAVGAQVHVWEPLPTSPREVPAAMARNALYGAYWPFTRTLASHRAEMGFIAQAFERAGVPAADRIDPAPAICPNGECGFVIDGLPLYSDGNHPARHSDAWFARLIERNAHFPPVAAGAPHP